MISEQERFCGHDEMLKSKYACLNLLSPIEMYVCTIFIYFGWEVSGSKGQTAEEFFFVIKFIYILTASLIEQLFIPPINSAFVAFAAREPSPIEFPHVDPTPQHLV